MGIGNHPSGGGNHLRLVGRTQATAEVDEDDDVVDMENSLRHHFQHIENSKRLLRRAIITAHDDYGMTFQEIADAMGVAAKSWPYKLYRKEKDAHRKV